MATAYPKDVPVSEIGEIVDIFRKGKVVKDKASFAHKAWVVQGYIQLKVFGDPSDLSGIKSVGAVHQDDDEQFLVMLESTTSTDLQPKGGFIPWGLLLKWFIKKLLANLDLSQIED